MSKALLVTILAVALPLFVACGGATLSILHAKGKPTGEGAAHVVVENSSGVTVEHLYVAKADDVERARASGVKPGSSEDIALWGDDLLGNAGIGEGRTFDAPPLAEGRYDVLAVDPDGREELVMRLALRSGGKYVLELGSDWAMAR